jgi:hypothetical protein
MKKLQSNRKLTLNTETVRHLRDLKMRELGQVHGGGEVPTTGSALCTPGCDPAPQQI